jgi:hypothetical protein
VSRSRPENQAEDAADRTGPDGEPTAAEMAGMSEEHDSDDPGPPRRRGRSPVVSLIVAAFGIYVLGTMFDGFRYWLRSNEPVDLGHAESLVQDGRLPEDIDNKYVVLRGTPDVQHAARMSTEQRTVGYLRIMEGDGSLFAEIPREDDGQSLTAIEGRYAGRIRRLRKTRVAAWVQQFFDSEEIMRVSDVSRAALADALRAGAGGGLEVATDEGPVRLTAGDRMRLVASQPDAMVQLGKTSFRRAQEAEETVASLGFPYMALERKGSGFRSFVVRIPEGERETAEQKLNEGLEVSPGSADPKLGALVLPRSATYTADVGELELQGETLVFPYGDNTTSPGYDVVDGKLVERALDGGKMRIGLDEIRAVRLERPIRVDLDGYLVQVGVDPKSERTTALLWFVVLGIVALNLVSPVLMWRRRST